ncbi:MarR family winged helix-turn-helix transcriptional regulator [Radiobacillus sp. PE A8.2]|uniref:MarR family winged helix-turn-helix transcriptional regulator n=1 Tax=Radiobacillus sp. PE A8.2 TaxID=3380349 RepID=UPI0038906E90
MNANSNLYKAIKEKNDQLGEFFANEVRSLLSDQHFVNLNSKQLMLLDLLHIKPVTMNEIAAAFQITPSAASQLVKKLENSNYVRREINLENRREILVELAEKGLDYIKKMEETEYYLMSKYYGQLDEKDLIQLKNILDKLYAIAVVNDENSESGMANNVNSTKK